MQSHRRCRGCRSCPSFGFYATTTSRQHGFYCFHRHPTVVQSKDEHLENRIRFLRKANIEGLPHSDRGLLDHLLGTRQLLVEWAARPAACDAGLFHSVGSFGYEQPVSISLLSKLVLRHERIVTSAWSHGCFPLTPALSL